jgi:hypothetical protein
MQRVSRSTGHASGQTDGRCEQAGFIRRQLSDRMLHRVSEGTSPFVDVHEYELAGATLTFGR